MTSKRRATPADYEALADSYETHLPTGEEILEIEVNPAVLPMGRPIKALKNLTTGKTPALPVRLPDRIRSEMKRRVNRGANSSESELVRQAIVEYFEHHPVS
ncbi:Uncharacterised protein [Mycobacteroides abscessus subsp. bolletii]|uniref:ribbon-helix-helix domain-containing protein n=1 Tax=Mycobacteroides abscessus TaxID=36809 RepID=UPI0009CC9855|nr:ribbon-helix-helix domain-containing protein [Mycobacteroides abscessus]SKV05518.1 Uncharacterised protein [Mycobacteroides abscessus subsp. bolletii]